MIRKINRDLMILVLGRSAQILIMLFSIKLSTALLDPTEMGNLYLIVSICSFFGFFFINPIGQYVNRKTHEWHHNGLLLNKLFNYNYYIVGASILSFLVVILLYSMGIANSMDYSLLIILIPLYVFFNTWNQTIITMLNLLEYRIAFTILTILTLLLALLSSYFIVIKTETSGLFWFFGQIIGLGVIAFIALIYFVKKIENKFSAAVANNETSMTNLKHILSFALPLSVGVLFLWMQNQSYRLIIEKYIGAEFLGYFGVGMAIAIAIASSFETIIVQLLSPKLFKHMNNETEFNLIFSDVVSLILPIYFLLAIFISFTAIYLTTILVDAKYASSFIFVIFGIWIEFFRMSSGLLSTIAHSKMQTKLLIVPYTIGGLFTVIGVFYGCQTESYTLLIPLVLIIGALLTFISMYIIMNKLLVINLPIKNIIHLLPYIPVFLIPLFLYDYSNNIYISATITMLFGLYFLIIIYLHIMYLNKKAY